MKVLLLILALGLGSLAHADTATWTPTITPTATPTASPTRTITQTTTPTPTASPSPTATPTQTLFPTFLPTPNYDTDRTRAYYSRSFIIQARLLLTPTATWIPTPRDMDAARNLSFVMRAFPQVQARMATTPTAIPTPNSTSYKTKVQWMRDASVQIRTAIHQ